MARRRPLVLVVEVERAKDWELPDDGRRIFTGTERIVIAEPPASPALNLPPWLMIAPTEGIARRPRSPLSASAFFRAMGSDVGRRRPLRRSARGA